MAASVKKDPVAAFRLPRMHAGRDRNVLTEAGNIFSDHPALSSLDGTG